MSPPCQNKNYNIFLNYEVPKSLNIPDVQIKFQSRFATLFFTRLATELCKKIYLKALNLQLRSDDCLEHFQVKDLLIRDSKRHMIWQTSPTMAAKGACSFKTISNSL